ncbi:MAG: hypothetical protein WBN04_02285 [Paracoccaceae bacterium]
MERRKFLALATAAVLAPAVAWSGPLEDQIVAQLRGQGYDKIAVSRTLLGRTRFVATSASYRREIILNPRTGEILRDFWLQLDEDSDEGPQIFDQDSDDSARGGSSGGGDSGDDGGDDSNDDGDDDDGGDDDGSDDNEPEDRSSDDHEDDSKDDSKEDSEDAEDD